jgi:hypothetical protein
MGVPTAPMVTQRFEGLVTKIAHNKGIPNIRLTYTPHPITDRPAEICREYIAGNDPISGQPMLDHRCLDKVTFQSGQQGWIFKERATPQISASGYTGKPDGIFP